MRYLFEDRFIVLLTHPLFSYFVRFFFAAIVFLFIVAGPYDITITFHF